MTRVSTDIIVGDKLSDISFVHHTDIGSRVKSMGSHQQRTYLEDKMKLS